MIKLLLILLLFVSQAQADMSIPDQKAKPGQAVYKNKGNIFTKSQTFSAGASFSGTVTGLPSSVSNADGSLTISPTTGPVVASLNLAHSNIWSADQTINSNTSPPLKIITSALEVAQYYGSGGFSGFRVISAVANGTPYIALNTNGLANGTNPGTQAMYMAYWNSGSPYGGIGLGNSTDLIVLDPADNSITIGDIFSNVSGGSLKIGGPSQGCLIDLQSGGGFHVENGPDGADFNMTSFGVSLNSGDTEPLDISTGQAGTLTVRAGDGDGATPGGIAIFQGGADGGAGAGYASINPNGVDLRIGGPIVASNKLTTYNGKVTSGWGVPAINGYGRGAGFVAANASVSTYTLGGSDGSFIISANVLVTSSTTHNFSVQCTYTDEGNTSRTVTFNLQQLGGTLVTAITNVTGVGAYEGIPLHIRAKASTVITIKTTGTFTSVVYNADGCIQQIA